MASYPPGGVLTVCRAGRREFTSPHGGCPDGSPGRRETVAEAWDRYLATQTHGDNRRTRLDFATQGLFTPQRDLLTGVTRGVASRRAASTDTAETLYGNRELLAREERRERERAEAEAKKKGEAERRGKAQLIGAAVVFAVLIGVGLLRRREVAA